MAVPIVKEPFTYRDLDNFPDDGKRREIIGGELLVSAAPSTRHQRLIVELVLLIGNYLKAHDVGTLFAAPTEVMFSDIDVAEPDIFVVLKGSRAEITDRRVVGPPDWIIEVLSPSTADYDLETKRKLYRAHGVLYWIVDPDNRTVTVWDSEQHVYSGNASIDMPLLPGLHLKLSELFAVLD
jgi:Uma2 family endonuclease